MVVNCKGLFAEVSLPSLFDFEFPSVNANDTVLRADRPSKRSIVRAPLTYCTTERDHILGISYSPRLYVSHISIWTKQGNNRRSIEALQETILSRLSEDLRPTSEGEYYYKRHSEHEGFNGAAQAPAVVQ